MVEDFKKSPEDKETERKTPVFVTYRNNDLFDKYGSAIVDAVTETGHPVITQVFEAGTSEKEMIKWATEHREELKKSIQVIDGTLYSVIHEVPNEHDLEAEARGEKHVYMDQMGRVYLDEVMEQVIGDTLIGVGKIDIKSGGNGFTTEEDEEKSSPWDWTPEETEVKAKEELPFEKALFLEALKRVPENRKDITVYISSGPDDEEEGTLALHENFVRAEHANPRLAQVISEAFKKAGFADVRPIGEGINGMTKEEWQSEYNKAIKETERLDSKTYIVVDRHRSRHLRPDRVLQVPLPSFIEDLMQKLDAKGDETKMAEAVRYRVADCLKKVDAKNNSGD